MKLTAALLLIIVVVVSPRIAMAQAVAPPPGRWAMIAGANTDARAATSQDEIIQTLVDRFGYSRDRITILRGPDATQNAIRQTLSTIGEKLRPSDSFFVFVGFPQVTRRGESFIVPTSSRESDIWTLLRREELEQIVGKMHVGTALLILPDCGDGSSADGQTAQQGLSRSQSHVATITFCDSPPRDTRFDEALAKTLKSINSETGRFTAQHIAQTVRDQFGLVRFDAKTTVAVGANGFELVEERRRTDSLLALLSSSNNADDRSRALKALASLARGTSDQSARDAVVQGLLAIVKNEQEPIPTRIDTAAALGDIGGPAVVTGIGPLSTTAADLTLRRAVIAALAKIRTPDTLPLLQSAFADPSPTVRVAAVLGVGSHPSLNSAVPIIGRLGDADPDVRVAALQVLAILARPAPGKANIVTPQASAARKAVTARLKDPVAAVRREAVNAFAALGGDMTSTSSMFDLLQNDPNPTVRMTVALFVGRMYRGDTLAVPGESTGPAPLSAEREIRTVDALVRAATRSSPTEVRTAAIWSLGEIGTARAATALMGYLTESDPSIKQASVEALGKCRWSAAVPSILPMLGEGSPKLRAAAASSLGLIRDTRATGPLLETLSRDTDPFVRAAAENALHALPSPGLAVVSFALQNPSARVRLEAVEQLATSKEPAAAVSVIEALGDEDPAVRSAAMEAVKRRADEWRQALEDAFTSGRSAIRVGVAAALGVLGDAASARALLNRYRSEQNPIVRAQIVAALGSARQTAPEIEDVLLAAADDPDVVLRLEAARALGAYTDDRSIERLKKMADEDAPEVRDRAIESLRRINKL